MSNSLTIGKVLLKRSKISPNHKAVGWIENNHLKFLTFYEYFKDIESKSLGLLNIGVNYSDKVAILCSTRKEWNFIDLAVMSIRATTVPVYPSFTSKEVKFILKHSASRLIVVENEDQFEKFLSIQNEVDSIEFIITIDKVSDEILEKLNPKIKQFSYDELTKIGKEQYEKTPDKLINLIQISEGKDIASIIYTSGTTGEPKGAVITNEAFTTMFKNVQKSFNDAYTPDDRTLTWLPLSHVFGRCDSLMPITLGWQMVFSRGMDYLIKDIELVRPTIMMAVPRIFEKIYTKINDKIKNSNIIQKNLFNWAMKVSDEYFEKLENDLSPSPKQIIQRKLAYNTVLKKVYDQFGSRIRFFISGGAPIAPKICQFLRNCNLTILEGYGLTETIAPCCLNPPSKQFIATVGIPMGDVEIKIADDGEILIKTKAMFSEYYKNEKETQAALKDGWFYSGDIGKFDKNGYLQITDRKKEIIITAAGKNISPQKIENLMKLQKHISQFIVVGDRKKFLTGIVGIEKESFKELYSELGIKKNSSIKELSGLKSINKLIEKEISNVNKDLASFETIKNFCIAPFELNTESGFVTPSLKLKRNLIIKHFESEINKMYEL